MKNIDFQKIRNLDDVLVGIFLMAVAVFGLFASWHLRPGSISAMGPGYVPRLVLFLQLSLGLAIALQGFVISGEPLEGWSLRPIVWILVAIAFFAAALEPLGLIVATIGLILLASFAHRGSGSAERRPRLIEVVLSMLVLTTFCVVVFVYLLGLTIPVWPHAWVH